MTAKVALRHAPLSHTAQRCCLRLVHRPTSPRYSSNLSHLRDEMVSRRLPYAADYMTPTQTRSLRLTLQSVLPFSSKIIQDQAYRLRYESPSDTLSPTHHLVYFPNVVATSLLLPDGTDSWHSPGPPFTRRMWAGGSMTFFQDILMNGDPYHCSEAIDDVWVKGDEGRENVFVKVKRTIYAGRYPGELSRARLDQRIYRRNTGTRMIEDRTLVFMRNRAQDQDQDRDQEQDQDQEGSVAPSRPSSIVFKPKEAQFSHTMVPSRELLFRFSALTFNAHAIHLDKQYCQEKEGHRNLLVHGPLTAVLMIEVLRSYLRTLADDDGMLERIEHIQYKNLRPLYAEEKLRICVSRAEGSDLDEITTWFVWIERGDGGYAAKGTVETSHGVSVDPKPYGHFYRHEITR